MKNKFKVLLICRHQDKFSLMIYKILKKNFKFVTIFYSKKYNEKITKKIRNWKGDYIFSFRSLLILPNSIIKNAKIAAINFHPGPPEYRGVGCLNYALYNDESNYGVTAHLIKKEIDYGEIIKTKIFKISPASNLEKVLELTHKKLYLLTKEIILKIKDDYNFIDNCIGKNKYKWSKIIKTKSQLDKFYNINKNITKKKLNKKLRATITKKFKPYIEIHNKKFYYSDEK